MSKTKSGLILIAVSAGMYLIGPMLAFRPSPLPWALTYSLIEFLEFASLVVGLFGVFRLIVGLLSRKTQAKITNEPPPADGVWPPAPKRPHYEEREN